MSSNNKNLPALAEGMLSFSMESRILRELGERLVKQPEVAVLELVKNAYDADSTYCAIDYESNSITVNDDGLGMTLSRFESSWMRIGTSAKADFRFSEKYLRLITGEKGIGRFAVRFLGRALSLESVADDPERGIRTRLTAEFDWPKFDRHEDLGEIKVPYRLVTADSEESTGTRLIISRLRAGARKLDLKAIRTGSVGVLSPLRSLFTEISGTDYVNDKGSTSDKDPGFVLRIKSDDIEEEGDVAAAILKGYVLQARLILSGPKLVLLIYRRGQEEPYLKFIDSYPNQLYKLYADIRFFPQRAGTFRNLPVDGRRASSWLKENAGIAVFDKNFRVQPYGMKYDDWLRLAMDANRNWRHPRSSIAKKHFPMSPQVMASTAENWMLRLPEPEQTIGVVQVDAQRANNNDDEGLIAAADREGFLDNEAYQELYDLVRGAVEALAYADRLIQREEEELKRKALIASIRDETRLAINEIKANPRIAADDKVRIVTALAQTQRLAEQQEVSAREREQQLEVMSLLGVVAGFMTHEFGVALQELEETHSELDELAKKEQKFQPIVVRFRGHIKALREFVTYSAGYIRGTKTAPEKPYFARPRLQQVKRIFGKYADDRGINVEVTADRELMAPLVPVSLYNGIALNLYTNALKAVTAKLGNEEGKIAFRAWNDDRWHYLEVSDTGIGIPNSLKDRVFDPLFTTTQSRNDPLGSGMGLGLALVKRGAEAFGGKVELVSPPAGFTTCVRMKLPLDAEGNQS